MAGFFSGFFLGFAGSILAAGPASAMILHQALSANFRRARMLAAGASLAETLYCFVASAGILFLINKIKAYESAIETFGAALLILTGIIFFRLRPPKDNIQETPEQRSKLAHAFVYGFLLIGLNPVLILTWGIALATVQSLLDFQFHLFSALLFPIGAGLGAFLWFYLVIRLIEKHHGKFNPLVLRKLFVGIGILLFATGGFLFGAMIF